MADGEGLAERLAGATGADPVLDAELAAAWGVPAQAFTSSVEAARALVVAALPGWRLHLGFGVTGVFPYAALCRDGHHLEAEAPSVPLAILRVALKALEPGPAPAPGRLPRPPA